MGRNTAVIGAGFLLALAALTASCAAIPVHNASPHQIPESAAARMANYGYVPLDPLPLTIGRCSQQAAPDLTASSILSALPDLTVRFAIAEIRGNGSITFGPVKSTSSGSSYRAILDYTNTDTITVTYMVRMVVKGIDGELKYGYPSLYDSKNESIQSYEAVIAIPGVEYNFDDGWEAITVPIYIGVGLRLTADIYAMEGGIVLSGLGVIGAQAEAGQLAGTLTVQTLGIRGKSIAVALPLPNKLDQTTIENAILAVGSSRALMYGGTQADPIEVTPRIIGLYSPLGSHPALINALYSALAQNPQQWPSCACPQGQC